MCVSVFIMCTRRYKGLHAARTDGTTVSFADAVDATETTTEIMCTFVKKWKRGVGYARGKSIQKLNTT